MALKGTAWLWKVPEGFPKGIYAQGTPEIYIVWDYKAWEAMAPSGSGTPRVGVLDVSIPRGYPGPKDVKGVSTDTNGV